MKGKSAYISYHMCYTATALNTEANAKIHVIHEITR